MRVSIICGKAGCKATPRSCKNLEELWYNRQHWWYGRQHLFNHFIMTPTADAGEETARVRCFFQILQFNVEYRTNFVFGIGTRDDVCVKRNGVWLFKQLYINAWSTREAVPWQGENMLTPAPGQPPRQAPPRAAE